MDKTSLGDRMKGYERIGAPLFVPGLPVVVRLDGVGFSKFTKDLDRPYDKRLSDLMVACTEDLCTISGALIGYTQSDEISLVFTPRTPVYEPWVALKPHKLTSRLASRLTGMFNATNRGALGRGAFAQFDARAFSLPTWGEVRNYLLWRERDATKNSISMAASTVYSHAELMGKDGSERQEMLFAKGINWNDYPPFFKSGTYTIRQRVSMKFTAEELQKLPPKHRARTNPDLEVERVQIKRLHRLADVVDAVDLLGE